ncbi:MAG: UDP-N-acetylmuramoyl-tripeptide--D-alanyl-D-alanine ligase [Pirellulales bacterium]|nr:UDP-N-acetylmuramoyl-tripeptide--D-alanyl-D-alanine ligase [Pirellulales bacterium]
MSELKLSELEAIVGGTLTVPAGARAIAFGAEQAAPCETARVGRVVIDSRAVERGDVFWALPGTRTDGANFAVDAYGRGAAGVVAARDIHRVPQGRWALRVGNSQQALEQLASWRRDRFDGRVIAVTGSVGKTTTRQMIETVLGHELQGVGTQGNQNNRLGLPLSMQRLERGLDFGVFEIGASEPGAIAHLAALCRPQIGVITRVAEAHLQGFGGQAGVADAKTELLDTLGPHGIAVLGGDCSWLRRSSERFGGRKVWFGRGADCDVCATQVRAHGGLLSFRVDGQSFSVPVWGRHHLVPALAAVAVGREFGLSLAAMAAALADFEPIAWRCDVRHVGDLIVINDAYNACPTAMRAALELLRDFDAAGRRVVVCGDMAELGDKSVDFHRRLGDEVVTVCGADLLVACGQHAAEVAAGARAAGMPARRVITGNSTTEAWDALRRRLEPGDIVLFKASRRAAFEQLVEVISNYGECLASKSRAYGSRKLEPAARRNQSTSGSVMSVEVAGPRHDPPSWVEALSSSESAVTGSTAPTSAL